MAKTRERRVPGTEILDRQDVQERKRHEDDVVYLIDPDTDEYTQVRSGQFYDVKPGTEVDVAPRTDRGGGEARVR